MSDATLRWQAQRIEELEAEIANLKDELRRIAPLAAALDENDVRVAVVRNRLPLSAAEARMLIALHDSTKALHAIDLAALSGIASREAVRVHCHRIRERLQRSAIETVISGYRLTPWGKAAMDDALGVTAHQGRAA